ncbi:MAG TPA: Lrp/AsnC family transcriptional regulator [Baekduia sp.]|nr:Lrp/AsnC family transcriptional regulator [Baekduia sp.]
MRETGGPLKLDDVDKRIIGALQADGRRPYSRIAAELDVSESVVRYRAQRLEQAGVLQVVGIADPLRIGFDRMAMIGLKVRPGTLNSVCAAVTAFPETSYVAAIAGSYDVIVEVICRDTAHFTELLTQRLHHVDGVVSTESFLVLEIHKMAYGWGVGEVATADAQPSAPRARHRGEVAIADGEPPTTTARHRGADVPKEGK